MFYEYGWAKTPYIIVALSVPPRGLVPGTGVEPARFLRALGPKPSVYTISPPWLTFLLRRGSIIYEFVERRRAPYGALQIKFNRQSYVSVPQPWNVETL